MAIIKPLGSRVLVQRAKPQSTKGGILLPDSAQEKPKEGTVVAVGPGKMDDEGKRDPIHVKVGDRVLFGSYSGTEVKNIELKGSENGEFLILQQDDILGVLA